MKARALVVSPFAADSARGNATTAARMAARLAAAGAEVELAALPELEAGRLPDAAFLAPEAVLVGVHLAYFERALAALGVDPRQPRATRPGLMLAIGGNDLYEQLGTSRDGALFAGDQPLASAALLQRIDALLVASEHQRDAVLAHTPAAPVVLVPRYPEVGFHALGVERDELQAFLKGAAPVITWCGAFREVKRPEWIAPILRGVRASVPETKLLLAGPTPTSGDTDEAELQALGGVLRVPPFLSGSAGSIGTLLAHTTLALNTSRSEGTANFLLEAMHESVPVLASNCPGTRTWAADHAWLFDTPEEAARLAARLLTNPAERARLAHAGATYVRSLASPERERIALMEALELASLEQS